MASTASIRDLRNAFPRVRRLVEAEGEVVVTEQGTPRFRLVKYVEPAPATVGAKNYLARIKRHQPQPMNARQARALHVANRGDR